jgi:OOP family OmpA-OmpF porin
MYGLFRWSGKWWPGLVPLAILWALAAWSTTLPLEADLAARSGASLKNTVLDKTRIVVGGRDVSFDAEAFSEDGRRSAVSSVEAVPGVRLVNDNTRLVAEAKPFIWVAERDNVRVTLWGTAPLPASRARIVETARAALNGTDSNVSLSGMARELGGREAIAAALKNLPDGFTVTTNDVKAPPYIFQANKDPVAVTLTLSGYVPDNNVHAALAGAAGRKFANEKILDNLKASIGAPAGFAAAVTSALGALSRLSTGTLVVSDREVKLSGDALYEVAADRIRAGLTRELPPGWQTKAEVSVKPAASPVDSTVCQQLFVQNLTKGRIRFETSSATINADSAGLLDRLIEIAMRCPTTNFEIIGHTDGDGDPAFNQTLSEKRARAVEDYLVAAGLPESRFTTTGYGSSQPIAVNDTDDGKLQNRRIEFVVRQ